MLRQTFYGLALSAALPVAALHAQAFNFTTSGGFVSNIANPPAVITHNTVTGPTNPFGVTRQVSQQFVSPTANPTVLSVSGTFTWFTADPLNTILGSYSGPVQLGAAGSFSFTNVLVTIINGTGLFASLRGSGVTSGSGQFFGDPTQPGDVTGSSSISWIGNATTVPEPGSSALLLAGLGALAVVAARRRAGARFLSSRPAHRGLERTDDGSSGRSQSSSVHMTVASVVAPPAARRRWAAITRGMLLPLLALATACTDAPTAPAAATRTAPSLLIVGSPGGFAQLSAGYYHTCALTTAGGVLCWGDNSLGQTSVPAAAQSGVTQVSVGPYFTCALTTAGGVLCWGENGAGQTTVPPAAQSGVTQVSTGYSLTCALTTAGGVLCWGDNSVGQTTVPPAAQSGVTQVSVGDYHTCAVTTAGGVLCWGDNSYGESTVPPAAQSGVTQVSAGGGYTCAVTTAGGVLCWGANFYGMTTVPTAAQSGVTQVSAGASHTCAVTTAGGVLCWGDNRDGEATVPTAAQSGVTQVSAGYTLTCALTTAGGVLCWGDNSYGQTTVPTTQTHVYPTATLTAPPSVIVGQSVALALTGAQVPGHPEATTFTYSFDCGSGAYAPASNSSTASCPTTAAGVLTVRGKVLDQDGDAAEYTASVTVTNAPQPQTITFTSTAPVTAFVGATYSVSATGGGSPQPVIFASATPPTCSVTQTTVTFLSVGLCTITANQAGNAAYAAAPQATQTVTVVKQAQTIAFTGTLPPSAVVGTALPLSATGGGSGAPIVFASVTPATCTVSGGAVTITAAGLCTVSADQAGNAAYLAAPQVRVSVTGTAPAGGWTFRGFLLPFLNPPFVNLLPGGVPALIRFDLGGDRGVNILASPIASGRIACTGSSAETDIQAARPVSGTTLEYVPLTKVYRFLWDTDRRWAGTCRVFHLRLTDGSDRTLRFKFF